MDATPTREGDAPPSISAAAAAAAASSPSSAPPPMQAAPNREGDAPPSMAAAAAAASPSTSPPPTEGSSSPSFTSPPTGRPMEEEKGDETPVYRHPLDQGAEEEKTVDDVVARWFTCTICTNPFVKPAVTVCGHIFCVECLLTAMNIAGVSNCALCKMAFEHLPSECKLIGELVEVGDKVVLDDITCAICQEMLFEPSVLKCGHVFCISCLITGGGMNCPSCGTAGSNNFIVCSYLDHFIEECFPDEYKSRTLKIQTSSGVSLDYHAQTRNVKLSRTHVGVGCDSCRIYPIQGNRFTCKTCVNFDLCEKCVKKDSSIHGRNDQLHQPDHVLELNDSFLFRTILGISNENNGEDGGEEEDGGEDLQLPEWQPGLLR